MSNFIFVCEYSFYSPAACPGPVEDGSRRRRRGSVIRKWVSACAAQAEAASVLHIQRVTSQLTIFFVRTFKATF